MVISAKAAGTRSVIFLHSISKSLESYTVTCQSVEPTIITETLGLKSKISLPRYLHEQLD